MSRAELAGWTAALILGALFIAAGIVITALPSLALYGAIVAVFGGIFHGITRSTDNE